MIAKTIEKIDANFKTLFSVINVLLAEIKRPIFRMALEQAIPALHSLKALIDNLLNQQETERAMWEASKDSYLKQIYELDRKTIQLRDDAAFLQNKLDAGTSYKYVFMPPLTEAEERAAVTSTIEAIKMYRTRMKTHFGHGSESGPGSGLKESKDQVEAWMKARGYRYIEYDKRTIGGPMWAGPVLSQ